MRRRAFGMLAAGATLWLALAGNFVPAPAVHVMRHLDTPEGERDPDLTAKGRENAVRLARWFDGKPLAVIYVSDFRRTRQTVAPLAEARGLVPKLYDPADTPALIARVRTEAGPVLVVGHSNTVPEIVAQLGGQRPEPLSHPDFGDIWSIMGAVTTHDRLLDTSR